MPSNALTRRRNHPGTPKVCRVIPLPPPLPPAPTGELLCTRNPVSQAAGTTFEERFWLVIPSLPWGHPATLTAAEDVCNFGLPITIYNQQQPMRIGTMPATPGDYAQYLIATTPEGWEYPCTLEIHAY